MTKFLIILIPGIIAFILCKLKSKYRMHITCVFVVYVILMNVLYNQRYVGNLMTFKRPVNQLIYQEEYVNTKEFPDAFLQLIVDGKTIYTKCDYVSIEEAEGQGFDYLYSYYHFRNPVNYLEHYGSTVISDEMYNNSVIESRFTSDFEDIGYANDLLRNVCMYYPQDGTVISTYFFHYWYYAEHLNEMHIYVNFDGIYDSDELVFLWQNEVKDGKILEEEDFYLMTKDYYDRNIK